MARPRKDPETLKLQGTWRADRHAKRRTKAEIAVDDFLAEYPLDGLAWCLQFGDLLPSAVADASLPFLLALRAVVELPADSWLHRRIAELEAAP